jgi:hypothetical protein
MDRSVNFTAAVLETAFAITVSSSAPGIAETYTVSVFTRHYKDCPYKGDRHWRQCNCRKSLYIYDGGAVRFLSTRSRSWTVAEKIAENLRKAHHHLLKRSAPTACNGLMLNNAEKIPRHAWVSKKEDRHYQRPHLSTFLESYGTTKKKCWRLNCCPPSSSSSSSRSSTCSEQAEEPADGLRGWESLKLTTPRMWWRSRPSKQRAREEFLGFQVHGPGARSGLA